MEDNRNEIQELEELHQSITLTMEDDSEVTCSVLSIFPIDEQKYIALLPYDEDGNTDGEVYLYRFSLSEDGDPVLENIEDEEEYQAAARAFDDVVQNLADTEDADISGETDA